MSPSGKDGAATNGPRCARDGCANPATKRGDTGPPRLYCSPACRQAAYRQRRGSPPTETPTDNSPDPLAAAIDYIEQIYIALPGDQKRSQGGGRLERLVTELKDLQRTEAARR